MSKRADMIFGSVPTALVIGFSLLLMGQGSSSVVGCYRFDRAYFQWVGIGVANPHSGPDSTNVVQLMGVATEKYRHPRTPGLDIQPIPFTSDSTTRRRWLTFSHWEPLSTDSIGVVWRNGLYGPVFRLLSNGDSLHGQVRFTTDVMGAEPPPQVAWAIRIPCPTR